MQNSKVSPFVSDRNQFRLVKKQPFVPSMVVGIWRACYQFIAQTIATRHEPQIEMKCDRLGRKVWEVSDPTSGYATTCHSEQEVRVWLEQRYYGG